LLLLFSPIKPTAPIPKLLVTYAPLVVLFVFGGYSGLRILYNLATFPICRAAFQELKQEMREAEKDLKRRGFVFEDKKTDEKTDKKHA